SSIEDEGVGGRLHLRETMQFFLRLTLLEGNLFRSVRIHFSEEFSVQAVSQHQKRAGRRKGRPPRPSKEFRTMGFAIEKTRTMISAMILGRKVTAQDVQWLRREVFAEGEVTRETADELFAVARAKMDNAPEWT